MVSQLVGFIRVYPSLRPAEVEYLAAFAESRRWRRPEGPYAVPDNPVAECLDPVLDLEAYVVPADGQPSLLCPWTPTGDGNGLIPVPGAPDTTVVEAVEWIAYLVEHFLGAEALAAGAPQCAGFGFDHVLDGAGAFCCAETGQVTHFRVRRNVVRVEVGYPGWSGVA